MQGRRARRAAARVDRRYARSSRGYSTVPHDEASGHPLAKLAGRRRHGAAGHRRRTPSAPDASITIAARVRAIAPLFRASCPEMDATRSFICAAGADADVGGWRGLGDTARRRRFRRALLLPNSMHGRRCSRRAPAFPNAGAIGPAGATAPVDTRDRPVARAAPGGVVSAPGQGARVLQRAEANLACHVPQDAHRAAARLLMDDWAGTVGRRWSRSRQARRTAARSAGRPSISASLPRRLAAVRRRLRDGGKRG